jgi:leucyl/phenylalanyl-tRNA--protein transferase
MTVLLRPETAFPDPASGPADEPIAIGGDLSVSRLLAAYRNGIFPWTVRPVTWWSPDPRGILELDGFHVSRSLARVLRSELFEVSFNRAFPAVIEACAEATPGRWTTWISREFVRAYTRLHRIGRAHSVECWQEGKLVGGVYGVHVGGVFAGESMFHRVSNASKVALFHLMQRLRDQDFRLFDIQQVTSATQAVGAREIPRSEYLRRLAAAVDLPCQFPGGTTAALDGVSSP